MTLDGIDISNHNVGINPAAVPGDFVIMRSSEGKGMRDPHFAGYDRAVRDSPKLAGAYHFAWVGQNGQVINNPKDEAANFARAIEPHLRDGFLVVLDWEPDKSRAPIARRTDWAVECGHEIRRLTGRTPLLYANQSTLDLGDWAAWRRELGTGYWLAGGTAQYAQRADGYRPGPKPRNPHGFGDPTIWQYTEHGYLGGWPNRLDLNILYGDRGLWRRLADGRDTAGGTVQVIVPEIPPLRENDPPVWLTDSEGRRFQGCICQKLIMPIFDQKLREAGLAVRGRDVMQGGYRGDVAASANTHNMGGVEDIRPFRDIRKAIEIGQRLGIILFWRNWTGNRHFHLLLLGCPHQHPEAEAQLSDRRIGYLHGKDGLARPGPFYGPRGLEPRGGWQEAYLANATITINEEDDVPDIIQTRTSYQHPGNDWLRVKDGDRFVDTCPGGRFAASAQIHGPGGVEKMRTRYVAFVGGDFGGDGWWRGLEVEHTGSRVAVAQAGRVPAPVQLDIWIDRPGEVTVEQQCTHWPG